jgi:Leucine-rich repeat (LRR) protein
MVSKIINVEKNVYLKILILHHNSIKKIDGLETGNCLEELDLSYNKIEVIENLDNLGGSLLKLNLECNNIKKISGLENLTNLFELNLSKNYISRLKGLQGLTNLRTLFLSSNQLSRCKQVAYLTDLPFLTDLDFCFNEVQTKKFYRYQILYYIPELRKLDGREVSHYEKVKADILFGADLENKKEIFNAYLPEEQFVDRRLFLKEQIDPESDSEGENLDDDKDKKRGIDDKMYEATNSIDMQVNPYTY